MEHMSKVVELKPCVFCGSKPKAMKWSATTEVEIICTNEDCGAYASGRVDRDETYEEAFEIAKEKWNNMKKEDDSAKVYIVEIHGCDDYTTFEIGLSKDEKIVADRLCKLSQEHSEYCCMPVMMIKEK